MANDRLRNYYIPKAEQMGIKPNTIWSVEITDRNRFHKKTVIVIDFNHDTLQIKVKIIGCSSSDEDLINRIEERYIGTFIHVYKPYEE